MNEHLRTQIPKFLIDQVVFCENLILQQWRKTCLLLLKNLTFLELEEKNVIKSVDLSATCLAKAHKRLCDYHESTKGVIPKEDRCSSQETASLQPSDISFGKFIDKTTGLQQLILLIKCWDKLVILQSSTADGLVVIAEYEAIRSYKLVSSQIKFCAAVQIFFQDNSSITTNFQNIERQYSSSSVSEPVYNANRNNIKGLFQEIRASTTELLVHKSMTKKEFHRLRNTQVFGCNFLRSQNPIEKMLLARCGDVWTRFAVTNHLVIGVPLVNNASASCYTVLSDIKPLFVLEDAFLNYDFCMFQQRKFFNDVESLEELFQSEEWKHEGVENWSPKDNDQMAGECFAILCIRVRTSDTIALSQVPLFVSFDIKRDLSTTKRKLRTFHQRIFIRNIDFRALLRERPRLEISFDRKSLHHDLLAVAITSVVSNVLIVFKTYNDLDKFEKLLVQIFDLKKQAPCCVPDSSEAMELEEQSENNINLHKTSQIPSKVFYNGNPNCLWSGTLALRCAGDYVSNGAVRINWRFYTKAKDIAQMLLELIITELTLSGINVLNIDVPSHSTNNRLAATNLIDAMRLEASALSQSCCQGTTGTEKTGRPFEQLLLMEYKTDVAAIKLLKNKTQY